MDFFGSLSYDPCQLYEYIKPSDRMIDGSLIGQVLDGSARFDADALSHFSEVSEEFHEKFRPGYQISSSKFE
jgi:hypothetical protein